VRKSSPHPPALLVTFQICTGITSCTSNKQINTHVGAALSLSDHHEFAPSLLTAEISHHNYNYIRKFCPEHIGQNPRIFKIALFSSFFSFFKRKKRKPSPSYNSSLTCIGLFFFFLTQFCDVAHVVTIHKDNLAGFGYNKGCVTLWRCHFALNKYLKAKRRIMKTQMFHLAKI
jgi:hypothetical protein